MNGAALLTPEIRMPRLVTRMAGDPVPNIRFNVAKTLGALIAVVDGDAASSQIRPALTTLVDDDDPDVKFFAQESIAKL